MGMIKRALCLCAALAFLLSFTVSAENDKKYIKWVDFKVTAQALSDAAAYDIKAHGEGRNFGWTELLSALGVKYGGEFSRYKKADLEAVYKALCDNPEAFSEKKLYSYYLEAYGAVIHGWLGEYTKNGELSYGIKAFSPIASGYYYGDYDDFGASRSFGYARPHLGHDMISSIGTPIIAIESGYVEACGWNMYGGWRIGIRSFDGKRYYYYAHLRKNHPYCDIYEGKLVTAGEVIGYLGMTGYSRKENVNNINVPHLHVGLQLIFDKSQKDGVNQIWVDMYEITKFLSRYRSRVYKDGDDFFASDPIGEPEMPD